MITQQGRIVALDPDVIWVESIRHTACGGCEANKGCGTGLIEQWFARPVVMPIPRSASSLKSAYEAPDVPLRIGDRVEFALPESAILRGALLTYLIPALLLVAGGLGGSLWAGAYDLNADLGGLLGALFGLGAFALVRRLHHRLFPARAQADRMRYQPTLVKYLGRIL